MDDSAIGCPLRPSDRGMADVFVIAVRSGEAVGCVRTGDGDRPVELARPEPRGTFQPASIALPQYRAGSETFCFLHVRKTLSLHRPVWTGTLRNFDWTDS